jgi:hypothetical protein
VPRPGGLPLARAQVYAAPSVASGVEAQVSEGRSALQRHAWADAYDLLAAADAAGTLGPEDLEALGEVAWATGRYEESQRARERAHAQFVERGARQDAARLAATLAHQHYPRGQLAVARGWHTTAERLLVGEPECRAHGLIAWIGSQISLLFQGDVERGLELGNEATEIGRRLGDLDIEMLAS